MLQKSHMIQQQNFEIQFEQFSDGIGIQNEIKDLFYEKLLPRIEYLFDEIVQEKYAISIEKLEIDCGLLDSKYWQEELVEETLRNLRQQLLISPKKEIQNSLVTGANLESGDSFHSFLFFLEKGYLPWNSRIQFIKELEISIGENLNNNWKFAEKIKRVFKKNPPAIERLLYSFSDAFFLTLLGQLADNNQEDLEKINMFLYKSKLTEAEKRIAHSLLFKIFSEDETEPEQFYSSLIAAIENPEKEKQLKKINKPEKIDCIYIQNAGLVLLHPFLPELFQKLELWIDKQWKQTSSQHNAVHVLEYLVSGLEEFPEFNLPLNKILCGMDVAEVLQPVSELTSSVKAECKLLLHEVIHHWSILKNTSIDGLRETFLQRNGKVSRVDNGWLLNVEQKGVDVLLNGLPWGIGVIKLPWIADTVFVEWI
jgi:hypothetical protein